MAMISSAAFPKVALRRPPRIGPAGGRLGWVLRRRRGRRHGSNPRGVLPLRPFSPAGTFTGRTGRSGLRTGLGGRRRCGRRLGLLGPLRRQGGAIGGQSLQPGGLDVELREGAGNGPPGLLDHRQDEVVGVGFVTPGSGGPLDRQIDHLLGVAGQAAVTGPLRAATAATLPGLGQHLAERLRGEPGGGDRLGNAPPGVRQPGEEEVLGADEISREFRRLLGGGGAEGGERRHVRYGGAWRRRSA